MSDPEGAILQAKDIKALFKTARCHLPVFVNGEIPWIVRSGMIDSDDQEVAPIKIFENRHYIKFIEQSPNRYFFENDGYFPWGYQKSCLFVNYWLAWGFTQQLNKECIEKNLK